MKLPAIISAGTSAKLAKARNERDRIAAVITDSRDKLAGLDVGLDDYAAASLTLAAQVAVHERALEVADRQIAGLEAKFSDENLADKARRRATAIKTVEAMLPEREKIVGEIETAIKALPRLFEKLTTWREKFVKQYPVADVEFPYAHFVDSDRVLRIVVSALRNIRAEDFTEHIDGLAAGEAEQHAALVADLKSNVPTPQNEEAA